MLRLVRDRGAGTEDPRGAGGRRSGGRQGPPNSCVGRGAGEVVLNSMDADGVRGGFDIEMLSAVCDRVDVPVIASGGAGKTEDFIELFRALPRVDAGLAASVFHYGEVSIPELKKKMSAAGIPARIV